MITLASIVNDQHMHLFTLAESGETVNTPSKQESVCWMLRSVYLPWQVIAFSIQMLGRWPCCKVVLVFKSEVFFYALGQSLMNIGYWLGMWAVHKCRASCFPQISFKYSKAHDRVCINLNNFRMRSARICMIIFCCCREGQMFGATLQASGI